MKNFLHMLFGGLLAVLMGLAIVFGAGLVWSKTVLSEMPGRVRQWTASVSETYIKPIDGTYISGLKRMIRYSAAEEEDILNVAEISSPAGSTAKVTARAYLIKDLTTGKIVDSRDSDRLLPVASLTKLVTAVVAKDLIEDSERVAITKDIVNIYGNTAEFRTGETFKAADLYYPLLMVSSNDAAEALASNHGRTDFIAAMNDFAQSAGAYRTRFTDPSGLSKDNVSTASDMAVLLDWIRINRPEILEMTGLKSKNVRAHTWVNPTHFLSWSNYIGGKNGYTEEADRTSASLFRIGLDKKVYAVIVLGSTSRDLDVFTLLSKIK